jgi:hypothetical protein
MTTRPDAAARARQPRTAVRLGALRLTDLWVLLAIALPGLAALAAPMSTIDLAYQVRAGQLMIDSDSILRVDLFTFSAAGQPWTNQQWLAQILLGALFRVGGWPLLAILHAALVAAAFGLLLAAARARGASPRVAAWITIAAFLVATPALGMRPQLVGLVLFALTLWLVSVRHCWRAAIWLVPVVAVVWANVHGSFVLSPLVVALAWLDDRHDRGLLVVAVLVGLATLINPFAIGVWTYAAGLTTNPAIMRLVTEWQRTNPLSATGGFYYASVLVVAAFVSARRRLLTPLEWVGLIAFAGLGAYAERGVAWWAFAAAWLLARPAGAAVRPTAISQRSSVLNTAVAGGIALVAIALLPWPYRGTSSGLLPLLTDAPSGIATAVQANSRPGQRLFANQAWASWLELETPGLPVLVDSRVEVAPADAWDDYLAVSGAAPGWQAIVDRRGVALLVVSAADQPALLAAASADPRWRRAYGDRDGALFARS